METLFVHIPHYEAGRTVDPAVLQATVESILAEGLKRGQDDPVLARTMEDADSVVTMLYGHPHVIFVGDPEMKIGIDCSFGAHVPADQIVAVVYPKRGESIREAFERTA